MRAFALSCVNKEQSYTYHHTCCPIFHLDQGRPTEAQTGSFLWEYKGNVCASYLFTFTPLHAHSIQTKTVSEVHANTRTDLQTGQEIMRKCKKWFELESSSVAKSEKNFHWCFRCTKIDMIQCCLGNSTELKMCCTSPFWATVTHIVLVFILLFCSFLTSVCFCTTNAVSNRIPMIVLLFARKVSVFHCRLHCGLFCSLLKFTCLNHIFIWWRGLTI